MRYQGKIIKWYDDKGYGFIRATEDSKDVFLHVSDISKLNKRPVVNEVVSYELSKDSRGRYRATQVAYQTKQTSFSKSEGATSYNAYFLLLILLFFVLIAERAINGFLPISFLFVLVGANLLVFLYYYQDKTSAIKKGWRTPEATLHWFSLLGGWPGAYIAQKMFKHKHKKSSFMLTYKLTVLLNCLIIALYSIPDLQTIILAQIA